MPVFIASGCFDRTGFQDIDMSRDITLEIKMLIAVEGPFLTELSKFPQICVIEVLLEVYAIAGFKMGHWSRYKGFLPVLWLLRATRQ